MPYQRIQARFLSLTRPQIFSAPQLGTSIETPHSTITVPVVRLILCLRRAGAEISPAPVVSAAPMSVSWLVAAALDTCEIRGDTANTTLHTLKVPSHYKPNVKGKEISKV